MAEISKNWLQKQKPHWLIDHRKSENHSALKEFTLLLMTSYLMLIKDDYINIPDSSKNLSDYKRGCKQQAIAINLAAIIVV